MVCCFAPITLTFNHVVSVHDILKVLAVEKPLASGLNEWPSGALRDPRSDESDRSSPENRKATVIPGDSALLLWRQRSTRPGPALRLTAAEGPDSKLPKSHKTREDADTLCTMLSLSRNGPKEHSSTFRDLRICLGR